MFTQPISRNAFASGLFDFSSRQPRTDPVHNGAVRTVPNSPGLDASVLDLRPSMTRTQLVLVDVTTANQRDRTRTRSG